MRCEKAIENGSWSCSKGCSGGKKEIEKGVILHP